MVFRGQQWSKLLIYLDDIIVFSKDITEHFARLDEILSRLRRAGLKLKPSKCELLKLKVLFLSHIFSNQGISPNPKLVKAIANWKPPTNVK